MTTGVSLVVQVQTMSASRSAPGSPTRAVMPIVDASAASALAGFGDRDTTTTSSIGRTARIASRCDRACTPAPYRTRRRASSRARNRVARPLTAAVRSAVREAPSTIATGAWVSASNRA